MICGRFEGVDERILQTRDIEEVSLGDYVLSGGEPAAIALIDAVVRLVPGVPRRPRQSFPRSPLKGTSSNTRNTPSPPRLGRDGGTRCV